LAFVDMMKRKITMPANLIRESGGKMGDTFELFSDSAQRIGVYTAHDYVDIMQKLIDRWEIAKLTNLTDDADKARDYLMKLPNRMLRIAERMTVGKEEHIFKWVQPAIIK